MTIYVVHPFRHRHRSSLMMQMLAASGQVPLAHDPEYDAEMERKGYAGGGPVYELPVFERQQPDIHIRYEGHAIKLVGPDIYPAPVHDYKVVLISRDPDEVAASLLRIHPTAIREAATLKHRYWDRYHQHQKRLRMQSDMDVFEMASAQLVDRDRARPLLERLIDWGWPVELEAALGCIKRRLDAAA